METFQNIGREIQLCNVPEFFFQHNIPENVVFFLCRDRKLLCGKLFIRSNKIFSNNFLVCNIAKGSVLCVHSRNVFH